MVWSDPSGMVGTSSAPTELAVTILGTEAEPLFCEPLFCIVVSMSPLSVRWAGVDGEVHVAAFAWHAAIELVQLPWLDHRGSFRVRPLHRRLYAVNRR